MMRIAGGAAILFMGLAVSSCAPKGVTIPPGWEDLVQCDASVIEAQTMDRMGEPGCDLRGSTIVLPDATAITVGEVGSTSSQQAFGPGGEAGPEYTMVNWGVPGVGVSKKGAGRTVSWATSDAALELQVRQLRL